MTACSKNHSMDVRDILDVYSYLTLAYYYLFCDRNYHDIPTALSFPMLIAFSAHLFQKFSCLQQDKYATSAGNPNTPSTEKKSIHQAQKLYQ